MKIKLGELKRLIKETVESMNEGVDVEGTPSARSYLGVMKRNAAGAADLADLWDQMCVVANGPEIDPLSAASDLSTATGLDKAMISFHLRKLVNDLATGRPCPTGQDLLDAAEAYREERSSAAARAAANRPPYDPEETARKWDRDHPNRGYYST